MLTSFCNSIIPLWQLNGLGKGSLTVPGIRWQKVFPDLEVLCHVRAATPALILGNLRVKTSVTCMGKEDKMFVKLPKYTGDYQAGHSVFRSLRTRVQGFFYTVLD